MLVIARTPVRISFFGGGTDYPNYFRRSPGLVLGATINKFTHVSVNSISSFFDHSIRIGYSITELVKHVQEIKHPSIRECLKHHNHPGNLDIHIFSDLPAKTGLGSSSSFTVGFLNALYAMQGRHLAKQQLAEEACFIEQQCIQENVGSQDQFHAAFGGFNLIQFSEDRISVRPALVTKATLDQLNEHMIVFYTGITRFASEILDEQIKRTATRDNDSLLQELCDLVPQAEKSLQDVETFGKLLDESWKMKKQLSSKISTPCIDEAYEKAMHMGAYGGKLCGAGGGGFLVLFAPPDTHAKIRNVLKPFLEVDVAFEPEGSKIIYMRD